MIDDVGPVFENIHVSRILVQVLRSLNPSLRLVDEGSYLRVLVRKHCVLTKESIEGALGAPFHFPQDLESIMPSFRGRIHIDEEKVEWII